MNQFKNTHPDVNFQVTYSPYQLNPQIKEPKDKTQHYISKFGEARFKVMNPQVTATAAAEGIKLKFGGVTSNTFDSHRLIWWANQFHKQDQVVEKIMELYFEKNEDLSDHENLATCAEQAGLDKEKALALLNSDEGVSEVKELIRQNVVSEQISGVPYYIINDKYGVSGAQEPETLVNVFEQVIEAESA